MPVITPTPQAVDIDAIARKHVKLHEVPTERGSATTLRIFVTLAMPEGSLKLLIDQAERTGTTLMLRGLKSGSMTQTLATVQALIGDRKVNWQIDPEAFNRFRIQHAPTFVLMRSDGVPHPNHDGCITACPADGGFFSVAGDVSLGHALEAIARRYAEAKGQIAPLLQRLRDQR
jgi:conjugal transfer pilus assembly protein TrbC